MLMIRYHSTNKKAGKVRFSEALLKGLAPDKGLFMLDKIPSISEKDIKELKNKKYHEIAFIVLRKFLKGDIPEEDLKRLCRDAYNFEVPVEKVNDKDFIVRLDHGPTASFKDFAARMMARWMQYFMAKEKEKLVILVATSGDTGGAVANAFYGMKNIDVVILMPCDEISDRQRKQMTTLGKNIHPIVLKAKFDDCQALVKEAFVDPELSSINLSSANSINIGRLLPQSVYYFYGYSKIAEDKEKIVFSVPSGNFGNLMGGLLAKKMGLPIDKFVVAVNENDEVPIFFEKKQYKPIKPSRNCLSNAMNVGHPSNLARLVDLYNGQMDEKGNIVKMPDMKRIHEDMFAISVNDKDTVDGIKDANKKGIILEPHGAVGWMALKRYDGEYDKSVLLETAHPSKFPEELKKLGIKTEITESLKGLDNKKEDYVEIKLDYKQFKEFLIEKFVRRKDERK